MLFSKTNLFCFSSWRKNKTFGFSDLGSWTVLVREDANMVYSQGLLPIAIGAHFEKANRPEPSVHPIIPSKPRARMVDYQNPVTIEREYADLVKLWHFVDGIFIWEFMTTLNFEWDFIRGRHPYRWTIWVYSIARLSMLSAAVVDMIGFNVTSPINCQAWVTIGVISSYTSFATSSLLILLRVVAIWNKNKIIIGIAMALWIADISFQINGTVRVRSTWSPEAVACSVLNYEATKPNMVASLVTDVVLLTIMLVGLFRLRRKAGGDFGRFGFGRILLNQGIVWLFLATTAEVPPTTLVFLNLNVPLNLMFQIPSNIIVTIAATRMYRLLVEHGSEICSSIDSVRGNRSDTRHRSGPIQLNRMEVTVRTEREQSSTSQITRTGGTFIVAESQGDYKEHELSLDANLESGPDLEK